MKVELIVRLFVVIVLALAWVAFWMALNAIWNGYVLSILWGWFAVPIYHLPALTIAQCIATVLVVRFVAIPGKAVYENEPKMKVAVSMGVGLVSPLIVLLVGWIVKGYLPVVTP